MALLSLLDRATVKKFYDAAIAAGAKDNGEPGPRPNYGEHYYAAVSGLWQIATRTLTDKTQFVYDPNGNNVEACCHDPES